MLFHSHFSTIQRIAVTTIPGIAETAIQRIVEALSFYYYRYSTNSGTTIQRIATPLFNELRHHYSTNSGTTIPGIA